MILVAGASGQVGRAFAEVVQSGRRPWTELSLAPRGDLPSEGPRTVIACDVTDAAALAHAVPEARSIVHLAGVAQGMKPRQADHEVAAMRALIELAKARACERFVFLSATGAAIGASHPWLRAKGAAEKLLRESGVPFVVLRAGFVFSGDAPALHALMQVVRAEVTVRLPWLRAGRMLPIAAGDVAIAHATALDHHRMANATVDLGAQPALGLDDLLRLVAQRLQKPLHVTRLPFRGHALAAALAQVPVAPLTDSERFVRLFSVAEPADVAAYDRLIPMKRIAFVDELRRLPWGAPPPRPGDPLPVVQESTSPGLPLFIPGDKLREAGTGASSKPAWLGRTDPFGQAERGERSTHDPAAPDDRAT